MRMKNQDAPKTIEQLSHLIISEICLKCNEIHPTLLALHVAKEDKKIPAPMYRDLIYVIRVYDMWYHYQAYLAKITCFRDDRRSYLNSHDTLF